jgi:sensor histidine kinase YesM
MPPQTVPFDGFATSASPGSPAPTGRFSAWLSHPAVWHLGFWSISVLNEVVIAIAERRALSLAMLGGTVGLYATLAIPAYVNILLLMPHLARRRRYAAYVLALLAVCWAVALGFTSVSTGAIVWNEALPRSSVRLAFTGLMFTGIVAALDLGARHVREARLRAERERAHAERRLEHLKTQLNPHFLFNTLNSLYALAVARSAELPELILKHAALLRYVLYGADAARVPLSREIEFLADYVELERLRLDESTEVRFEVQGVVGGQEIAPLLLVPLVENCFKHLGSGRGEAAFVHLALSVQGAALELRFENSRDPTPEPVRGPGGIGLRNTRERLALLYPGRHALAVRETAETFRVELTLHT